MKTYRKIKSALAFLSLSLFLPVSAKAEDTLLNQTLKQIVGGGKADSKLEDFLGGATKVVQWGMNLAGVLVILAILYAAVLYLLAQGDEAKAETAKKTIIWAIVGAFFVAISRTILWVVERRLSA